LREVLNLEKSSAESPPSHKFLTLDALRGVAALVVVEFHFVGSVIVTHGYLAVDFFFLLSGFVLALAYQERLDAGWSTVAFLKVRLVRLYPLYILGMVLGLAGAMGLAKFGAAIQSWRSYVLLTALAVFMLPKFLHVPLTRGTAYPLDFPAWSLIIEIFANLFHGIALRRRSDRFLADVVIVSGALVLLSVRLAGNVDVGSSTRTLPEAAARVLFSYVLGMLLFRVWKRGKFRLRIPFLLSPVLLTFALMTPWCGHHVIRYDLLVIFFFFPLLLMASASSNPPPALTNLARTLGRMSYAIYVLHFPLRDLQEVVLKHRVILSPAWSGVLSLFLAITIALLADRFYDDPVRAFLQRKFIKTKRVKVVPSTPLPM
jgi:peptidoglycan/LPS O-acetylase OafA/YrhL